MFVLQVNWSVYRVPMMTKKTEISQTLENYSAIHVESYSIQLDTFTISKLI